MFFKRKKLREKDEVSIARDELLGFYTYLQGANKVLEQLIDASSRKEWNSKLDSQFIRLDTRIQDTITACKMHKTSYSYIEGHDEAILGLEQVAQELKCLAQANG